jgi:DHA1 family bicyclomycin/chloramphenicol resistance-like MFS transporter
MLRPVAPGSVPFLILLGAIAGSTAFAIDVSLPALPFLVDAFGSTAAEVQATLGLFLVGFALGQLVWGPLSDRIGRRPVVLIGMALFTLAGVGCTFAPTIDLLVLARLVQGAGASVGRIMAPAIVRDHFDRERGAQINSQMMLVIGVAPLIAPMVGALLLEHVSWRAVYGLLAVAGGALVIANILFLGESNQRMNPRATAPGEIARAWARCARHPAARANALVQACGFSAMFAYISGSPFVLIDGLGVDPGNYGYFFGATACMLILGAQINGRTVRRRGVAANRRTAVTLAAIAGAIGLALALLRFDGVWGMAAAVGPVMLFMVGQGGIGPNTTAAALEPLPDIAGVAASLIGATQMLIGAAITFLVGAFYDGSAVSMAGAIAACTMVGFVIERTIPADG